MAKSSKPSKNKAASTKKNQKVADLLALTHGAPPTLSFAKNKSTSRLFEIVVLADILTTFTSAPTNGFAQLQNAPGGVMTFAGAPCSADKSQFSWFSLHDPHDGSTKEAWISVQFTTLSWLASGAKSPPIGADKHEIDVGIFSTLGATSHYPAFYDLLAGVSCKHFPPGKESVREVLGLRRESAFLQASQPSLVPWLIAEVPALPASPIFLASSSTAVHQYSDPIDKVGVYTSSTPFK